MWNGVDGLVESVGGDAGRALVGKVVKSIEEASIQFAAQNCYVAYSGLLHARYRIAQAIFIFC